MCALIKKPNSGQAPTPIFRILTTLSVFVLKKELESIGVGAGVVQYIEFCKKVHSLGYWS